MGAALGTVALIALVAIVALWKSRSHRAAATRRLAAEWETDLQESATEGGGGPVGGVNWASEDGGSWQGGRPDSALDVGVDLDGHLDATTATADEVSPPVRPLADGSGAGRRAADRVNLDFI